jgi:arginyl-tRNA synthetase
MSYYNQDFIRIINDILEDKLKRKIKFNGRSIQTNLLSFPEIQILKESTNKAIKEIEIEQNQLKFIPNQIALAKISLSQPKFTKKHNELLLLSLHTPGQPISENNLRVLLAADFFINNRRELNNEVSTNVYFYPYSIEMGFLLCAFNSSLDPLHSMDPKENHYTGICLESLYQQAFQSHSKEDAQDAVNRLLLNDGQMMEKFDQILLTWKSTQETLFKKFKINLKLKYHRDLIQNDGLAEVPSKQTHLQNYYNKHTEITHHFHDHTIQLSKSQIGTIISVSFSKVSGLNVKETTPKMNTNTPNLQNWIYNAQSLIAKESMLEMNEKTNTLGLSFFKIQLLSMRKSNDVKYVANRIVNQNANIGIYIQYAYARLCGIERYIKELNLNTLSLNSEENVIDSEENSGTSNLDTLTLTPKVFDLIAVISNFNLMLEKSCTEPSVMVAYLFQLAKVMSSQYYHFRIKGEPEDVQKARWKVIQKCQGVLKAGLEMFGLETVDTF